MVWVFLLPAWCSLQRNTFKRGQRRSVPVPECVQRNPGSHIKPPSPSEPPGLGPCGRSRVQRVQGPPSARPSHPRRRAHRGARLWLWLWLASSGSGAAPPVLRGALLTPVGRSPQLQGACDWRLPNSYFKMHRAQQQPAILYLISLHTRKATFYQLKKNINSEQRPVCAGVGVICFM